MFIIYYKNLAIATNIHQLFADFKNTSSLKKCEVPVSHATITGASLSEPQSDHDNGPVCRIMVVFL